MSKLSSPSHDKREWWSHAQTLVPSRIWCVADTKIEWVHGAHTTRLQGKDTFHHISGILTLFLMLINEVWVHPKEFYFLPLFFQLSSILQFSFLHVHYNFYILSEYLLLL